ncbi:hypothetical protein N9L68_06365 [bacterium]|nr:hypothetical protein [bacterium]
MNTYNAAVIAQEDFRVPPSFAQNWHGSRRSKGVCGRRPQARSNPRNCSQSRIARGVAEQLMQLSHATEPLEYERGYTTVITDGGRGGDEYGMEEYGDPYFERERERLS